ncbi:lipid kinase [Rubrobacter indicoceani]|uniref:lipid kinase n=1 Tax=Rubrobacter indicoceani TaxID=2051957 RepID=UPI000E5BE0AA|nr:lipid kinase [Rubrobacter indicoceani]
MQKESSGENGSSLRAALVVNTRSRTGRDAFRVAEERLVEFGVRLEESFAVDDPGRISEVVTGLLGSKEDYGMIVLGGGDGTVSSTVDHLVSSEVVLGLLPLGTANDFARTLGIPTDVGEACRTIAGGKLVDVDLGIAGGNYYVNVASLGLGVGVTQALSPGLKRRVGALAYPLAAVRAFFDHEPFDARITFPDGDHEPLELTRLLQVAVGNGRFYGGGLAVSPEAGMDDGTLDVYAIELGRRRDLFGVARYMKSGDFIDTDCVHRYRTKHIKIQASPKQKVNVDGEIVARTPEEFRVSKNALRVMVPGHSTAARFDGSG